MVCFIKTTAIFNFLTIFVEKNLEVKKKYLPLQSHSGNLRK